MRTALDAVWQWLENQAPLDNMAKTLSLCEAQCPETEAFASVLVSSALDAANAVCITVEMTRDPSSEKAIEAATLARDSVDLYVQELEGLDPRDPNLEERIRLHPLMQRELRRQTEDLQFLRRRPSIKEMKEKWREPRAGSLTAT